MSLADSVLLIEGDASVADALSTALCHVVRWVCRVATPAAGLQAAHEGHAELIVLDVGVAATDGVAMCRALRLETRVPIVVLGVRRSEHDAVRLLDAGADDYVAVPFGAAELVARVRAQLRRSLVYQSHAPNVVYVGDVALDVDRRIVTREGRDVGLTPVEWRLFRVLATNAGRTLTHEQLYHAVWGNAFGDVQQSLRVHITHLRRKIEPMRSVPSIIVTEPGVGYRCELGGGGAAPARCG